MDNAMLDELERRLTQWERDTDGRSYPIACDELRALITAARRPALPDREALELILRDTLFVSHGYDDGEPVQFVGGVEEAALALITAARRPALPDREAVAREVYNTFSDQEGFVPWVEGGNSDKQFEARRVANRILALSPAAEITAATALDISQFGKRRARNLRPNCINKF